MHIVSIISEIIQLDMLKGCKLRLFDVLYEQSTVKLGISVIHKEVCSLTFYKQHQFSSPFGHKSKPFPHPTYYEVDLWDATVSIAAHTRKLFYIC